MPAEQSAAEKFVSKVTAAPDAQLDQADIETAKTERDEIVERAKDLAGDEREKLRKEIAEAAATSAAPAEQEALNKLAEDIQSIAAPETDTPPSPLPNDPKEALTSLPGLGSKAESLFKKGVDAVGKIFDSFSGSTMLLLASMLEYSDSKLLKGFSNWLRGRAEPSVIREAMEQRLKKKITKTPEDAGHVETLRAQYQAKLETDKKDSKTYSFQTFYAQKLNDLAALPAKETYTLADLVTIKSQEQAKVEEETNAKKEEDRKKEEEKKEEEKKGKETEQKLKENPQRTYIETFRDALNAVRPDAVPVREGETPQQIVEKIIASFSSDSRVGHNNYGLEIDGQTLNESDGGNYWYQAGVDWNVLELWEDKLRNNPVGAIQDFLNIDPAKWESTNPTAAKTFKKVREYMEKHSITPDSLTSGKAPENVATPKQEPPAADVPEFPMPMM